MDTQLIIKVAGIGILTAFCCQLLSRSGRDEQAMLLSLAGIITVLIVLAGKFGELFDTLKKVFDL